MAPVDNLIPWQALKPIQNDDERQRGSRAAARAGGCGFNQGESLLCQAALKSSARVTLAPARSVAPIDNLIP